MLSATYQSSGLYQAQLTPTIAGKYTVTVTMTNDYTALNPSLSTKISGSPFTVAFFPGLVDPFLCYSDVSSSSISALTANIIYNF